jgi:hypothetical protein
MASHAFADNIHTLVGECRHATRLAVAFPVAPELTATRPASVRLT